uniref:Uncharacterized protein n=1 Tax=Anopheles coluzzii TaxID=1518534 RepID=A0A8W7Q063_ANOCL
MIDLRSTGYIGVPLTPSPVTANSAPAGAGCGDLNSFAAVVTYRMSRLGPPNAAEVTCSHGSLISSSTLPVLSPYARAQFTLYTVDPPKVATYSEPFASIVMPSGTNGGRSPLTRKSITTRSPATNNKKRHKLALLRVVPVERAEPHLEDVTLGLEAHGTAVKASLAVNLRIVETVILHRRFDLADRAHEGRLLRAAVPVDERHLPVGADDKVPIVTLDRHTRLDAFTSGGGGGGGVTNITFVS